MRMNHKRGLWTIVFIIYFYSFISPALGIGVSPSSLDFGMVYRGDSSISFIYISTMHEYEHVDISVDGALEQYISVNPKSIDIGPGNNYRIELLFNPHDLPNGEYDSRIMIYAYRPVIINGSRSSTIIEAIAIPIHVVVTGEQIVSCRLVDAHIVYACDNIIDLGIVVENNGSVSINPSILVDLGNGSIIYKTLSRELSSILPGESRRMNIILPLDIDIYGKSLLAHIYSTNCIGSQDIVFVASRQCSQSIDVKKLDIASKASMLSVSGEIYNKGETPRRVRLEIVLYRNGRVDKLMSSDPVVIEPRSSENITVYLPRAEEGELRARVIEIDKNEERIIEEHVEPIRMKESKKYKYSLFAIPVLVLLLLGIIISIHKTRNKRGR